MNVAPAQVVQPFQPDDSFYICSECSDYIEQEIATQYGWHIYQGCDPMCPSCAYAAARL